MPAAAAALEPLPVVTGAQDASLVAGIKQQQAHTSRLQMAEHSCISAIQAGVCAPGMGHTPLQSVTLYPALLLLFFFFPSLIHAIPWKLK